MSASMTPACWRRLSRLSVRRLLLAVLALGTGSGRLVRSARVQRDAVEMILRAGGNAAYDWEWGDHDFVAGAKPRASTISARVTGHGNDRVLP